MRGLAHCTCMPEARVNSQHHLMLKLSSELMSFSKNKNKTRKNRKSEVRTELLTGVEAMVLLMGTVDGKTIQLD